MEKTKGNAMLKVLAMIAMISATITLGMIQTDAREGGAHGTGGATPSQSGSSQTATTKQQTVKKPSTASFHYRPGRQKPGKIVIVK